MQPLSSAIEARNFDTTRKGGYDSDQVDGFLDRAAAASLELEEQLDATYARIHTLERQLGDTKEAEQAVGVAFLAAADAKQSLIEDGESKAAAILEQARLEASDLSAPQRELEARRKRVEELIADTEQARARVDDEADELLGAARRQAQRMVSEARRDALAVIEESKKEADDWVHQARAEHERVALMLRGLKAAVRDMLDDAVEQHGSIRVVLAEEQEVAPASVRFS